MPPYSYAGICRPGNNTSIQVPPIGAGVGEIHGWQHQKQDAARRAARERHGPGARYPRSSCQRRYDPRTRGAGRRASRDPRCTPGVPQSALARHVHLVLQQREGGTPRTSGRATGTYLLLRLRQVRVPRASYSTNSTPYQCSHNSRVRSNTRYFVGLGNGLISRPRRSRHSQSPPSPPCLMLISPAPLPNPRGPGRCRALQRASAPYLIGRLTGGPMWDRRGPGQASGGPWWPVEASGGQRSLVELVNTTPGPYK